MSEPDDNTIAPLDPAEWQTAIKRSTQTAEEKASRASASRQQAEELLHQVADLRHKANVLAQEAEACTADDIRCETAVAEARKDKNSMETFARFLDIDLQVEVKDEGTSMVLDRVSLSLSCWHRNADI
jgi:chromosome segregation ATPase